MTISGPTGRRIPTLLGLVLVVALVAAVGFTTQAVQKITKIFSRAEDVSSVTNVDIANLTDTSVTVFWSTETKTAGAVFYGKSSGLGESVAVDDRDHNSAGSKYFVHFVRLTGLQPNTKYFYKIGVDTKTVGNPTKSDAPYEITTLPANKSGPIIDPIFGKVLDSSGNPIASVLTIWQSRGDQKIASLSKSDGSYVLPIGNANPSDGAAETISLNVGGGNPTATITCQIGKDRPLPIVKLGETIDCSKKSPVENGSVGFKTPTTSPVASPSAGGLTVNVQNGQTFNSSLPTISGKAGPNQVVQIVIHSETPYSGTVQADPSGSWSWTPPANLSPGQHTVTITIVNPNGTTMTETRTFTVESGSPILPITSGTPSATLTHLACVGATCSTVSGAGPNSCSTDGDCVATPSPAPPPPPLVTPPPTGSLENTLILLTLGAIFATLGLGVFLKHNG